MTESFLDKVTFRPAKKDECRTIARLYSMSSDGVADYLWTTLAGEGEDVLNVGERRYSREDTPFSYRNCVIAKSGGEVAGMIAAFPMTAPEEKVTQPEPDPVLAPYGRLECYNSYYIAGMAVFPEYRGQGIGTKFLEIASEKALSLGLPQLSLIVFEQNEGAKRLYERHGFYEIAREAVAPHELIHYTGYALLMVKDIV
ncbi:MAG TPA: GNAT family N-acetyltransferase [Thermodesulfobacteriota bacterium]|nr:GNAT family N-acetyltransferase [Thermodesulfobacteriota bacterium]